MCIRDRPQDAPPEIRARYTQLPRDLPARVHQLAHTIADPQPTAYDQARAIEAFLRQYPYSLDLSPPPADVDIVDYFLFDLQTGFCDYYASAMVVMALSLIHIFFTYTPYGRVKSPQISPGWP